MKFVHTLAMLSLASIAAVAMPIIGCEKKADSPAPTKPDAGKPAVPHDDHDHSKGHDHGPSTQLGEQTAGGFTIKASRDGDIKPGEDAVIDISVSGGTAKVAAVRVWIGAQDAKGSVKAKADLEKTTWHTHAEIPNPLPVGSKLWVEIEASGGEKSVTGFDLKM